MLQCPKCMRVKIGPQWIPTINKSRMHNARFVKCRDCSGGQRRDVRNNDRR